MTTKLRCPPPTHTHKHRRYSLSSFLKPLRNPVGEMHRCRLVCKHCAVGDTSRSPHLATHNRCNRDGVETLHLRCALACTRTEIRFLNRPMGEVNEPQEPTSPRSCHRPADLWRDVSHDPAATARSPDVLSCVLSGSTGDTVSICISGCSQALFINFKPRPFKQSRWD